MTIVELKDGRYDFSEAYTAVRIAQAMKSAKQSIPAPRTPHPWPNDTALLELYNRADMWRMQQISKFELDPDYLLNAKAYYRKKPIEFINHWCVTYDPRNASSNLPTTMPLLMFKRQCELVDFVRSCAEEQENGLIEKTRDMGATWVCCGYSTWSWLFEEGSAIGWGSRKEQLVDKLGDPDSIFEKMRILIRRFPSCFMPRGFSFGEHVNYMRIVNPETGATITGEAGDNIGRGGRKKVYFLDEAAHIERPESVEAALSENTNCQIMISSVHGIGNVFYRKREAGSEWSPDKPIQRNKTQVFVMDWRDHPRKSQAWYNARRQKASDEGLLHKFAQEVDRDYSASVEGIVIPAEWVKSAIDAHIHLGFDDGGNSVAALDVADDGGDSNAEAIRRGSILRFIDEWGERDTAMTTRRALINCKGFGKLELQYDSIGVGAGVKSEANRLADDDLLPKGVRLVPWNAGARVQNPLERVVKDDDDSPLNKDFYHNLKAQAWWMLRRRFEKTWRCMNEDGFECDHDELISLPSELPLIHKLVKELSQATVSRNSQMKLLINKKPDGTRSPNLADAVVMCFWPVQPPLVLGRSSFSKPKIISG